MRKRTSCSILCWKWTKTMVPMAKSEVPAKVSFEARDIARAQEVM
jgi:hypothetical protein